MAQTLPQEGKIRFPIPSVDEPCFTFYKIVGDLSSGKTPVLMIHGGPGAGHEYLLPFARLWQDYGIPVIFYDQVGCASSTHLQQLAGDQSFWQESLFVAELNNLIDSLSLRDGPGFHLYGHSWGGMLAAALASTRPRGLQRLVLANGLASMELGMQGIHRWVARLSSNARQTINDAIRADDFTGPSFVAALTEFQKTTLCRTEPFPEPELLPTFKNFTEDATVYEAMYGPTCLTNPGSLRGWTVIPRLPNIEAPTFVYNGEFDSSDDPSCEPFFELIPKVRWITFQGASHMSHLEGPKLRKQVVNTVGEFLSSHASVASE